MGSCCVNGNPNNVIAVRPENRISIKRKSLEKGLILSPNKKNKSRRSSIYVLNDEDITQAYTFEGQLGTGYYGTVKLAIPKNDLQRKYAVKSIDKTKLSQEKLEKISREIEILSSVDHPNIVKYYETYNDEQFFHIVMEYCTGGELFERIINKKYFTETEASAVIYKIASAIAHCHACGIVHRDLKPENILYESMAEYSDIKIIDFGLSRKFTPEHSELHSIVGSPYYVAPEVLEGKYEMQCDIWSLGVLMYVLLSGSPPFYSDNKIELYYKIRNEQPSFASKIWQSVSQEAIDLIKDMLNKYPKKRPKANKILEYSWFKLTMDGQYSYRQIDKDILIQLRSFQQPRKLTLSILKFIIKELKCSEIEKLKKTFTILDKSKAGVIEINQLKDAFQTCKIDIKADELRAILANCSKGGSEKINYSSFIAAAISKKNLLNKDLLWDTFKHLDTDNSGFITMHDMELAMKRTGKTKKPEDIQEMFKEAGLSNDAKISFEDFCILIEREF
jgi:calcium-dependent protein kinase